MLEQYAKKILDARVYDVARETPVEEAPLLGKLLGNRVLIKREDLQPVFSFKLRGAYNKIRQLSPAERRKGIVAASAGNHAQGVALAAAALEIDAVIVMPATTPEIKVNAVKARGARVILHGDCFDDAYKKSLELVDNEGRIYIHPYDDPEVIAGQGTIGMELLRQHPEKIDAIYIPVGGGGLIAGIAAYVKYLRPEIEIVGVESEESACLTAALKAGKRTTLKQVGIFADGVAVATIGEEPFRVALECVDRTVTVDTDAICAAIKDIFNDTRSICEPAGALALAGLKKDAQKQTKKNRTLIAINSGANVNFDRLRHISERAELGEGHEAILAVTIPEKPGSFKKFCTTIGKRDITEFNYRFADPDAARVFVGVQLQHGDKERGELIRSLESNGYRVVDMSEDEISKIHIRHMVGGHAPGLQNENLYHFEFPERPGALLRFLEGMAAKWNISLFHYRNHGAAFGRVLMGLQAPPEEKKDVHRFLDDLGYRHREISANPAYRQFLA